MPSLVTAPARPVGDASSPTTVLLAVAFMAVRLNSCQIPFNPLSPRAKIRAQSVIYNTNWIAHNTNQPLSCARHGNVNINTAET
jgi:hypothetical protein